MDAAVRVEGSDVVAGRGDLLRGGRALRAQPRGRAHGARDLGVGWDRRENSGVRRHARYVDPRLTPGNCRRSLGCAELHGVCPSMDAHMHKTLWPQRSLKARTLRCSPEFLQLGAAE